MRHASLSPRLGYENVQNAPQKRRTAFATFRCKPRGRGVLLRVGTLASAGVRTSYDENPGDARFESGRVAQLSRSDKFTHPRSNNALCVPTHRAISVGLAQRDAVVFNQHRHEPADRAENRHFERVKARPRKLDRRSYNGKTKNQRTLATYTRNVQQIGDISWPSGRQWSGNRSVGNWLKKAVASHAEARQVRHGRRRDTVLRAALTPSEIGRQGVRHGLETCLEPNHSFEIAPVPSIVSGPASVNQTTQFRSLNTELNILCSTPQPRNKRSA